MVTMGFDGFGGGGFGLIAIIGMVVWLAFAIGMLVLIGLGIRWLLRNTAGSGIGGGVRAASHHDAALTTLRERFARGEIDATEFEERKHPGRLTLSGSPAHRPLPRLNPPRPPASRRLGI